MNLRKNLDTTYRHTGFCKDVLDTTYIACVFLFYM